MLEWLRRVADQVNRADRELVRRSAALPSSPADAGLKMLTMSANHSLLWFVVAAVLMSRKGLTRRVALRGVLAIGGASFMANALAKPVLPRRRPAWEDVPVTRRLHPRDRPSSSSFPSGHAASAAAFATAAMMESRPLGMIMAPVAVTVAYSRVHTGVHWPTDVAAGVLLGTSAALITRRWWPVCDEEPAECMYPTQLPAPSDGEGLLVLINPGSGPDDQHPGAELATVWPAARQVFAEPGTDLSEQVEAALRTADRPVRALGVAGGDGTVAAVAAVAARRGLPLVVVPAGTFNNFARHIGETGVQDAVAAVRHGSGVAVDLGTVRIDERSTHWFINTASIGGYPELVRLRERWEPRWGKWPAAAAALIHVLRQAQPLPVRIDGVPQTVWLVFVGNGLYRPRGVASAARHRLDNGLLDVRYIRADVRFSRIRFLIGALSGALRRSHTYVQRECAEVDIEVLGPPVALATDGEVSAKGKRFRFCTKPTALTVYRSES